METNHQRIDEFKAEIGSLNIRTPADESERIWLIAGIVVVVLGLVLIGVGWYSAGGEVLVANQIPYLLSGGVLGLALVIIGGALFVRYSLTRYLRFWLIRSIYEDRSQADRQVELLEQIAASLRTDSRATETASQ